MMLNQPVILAMLLVLSGGWPSRSQSTPGPGEPSTAPAPASPALAERFDASGYYQPVRPVQAGIYRLDFLNIGADRPSEGWQEKTSGTYSPVILQFSDTTTPPTASMTGIPTRTRVEQVRPDRWRVTDAEIEFLDDHHRLGRVTFRGRLNQDALAAAKAGRPATPALSGTLTVGRQTFENVEFQWSAGS